MKLPEAGPASEGAARLNFEADRLAAGQIASPAQPCRRSSIPSEPAVGPGHDDGLGRREHRARKTTRFGEATYHWRLNWRLVLALLFNALAWGAILAVFGLR